MRTRTPGLELIQRVARSRNASDRPCCCRASRRVVANHPRRGSRPAAYSAAAPGGLSSLPAGDRCSFRRVQGLFLWLRIYRNSAALGVTTQPEQLQFAPFNLAIPRHACERRKLHGLDMQRSLVVGSFTARFGQSHVDGTLGVERHQSF